MDRTEYAPLAQEALREIQDAAAARQGRGF